ncbi:hypothetical protein ABB37_01951 [Leptomonas pyrrhocoris]|uniref:Uncharacterized protein n=1 Tax=Leptomonas pyrrhocoris TaxID=157538 RepID=A0A0N0DY38_LEPPY|nr:hypothetical protein ABB37_01951 [Leptomonas pyrrhocoris]KPA83695.1 hypothetical protein ABB37_01951 [Leptomonas pyrrhocoris]|eukprot:XP_015662134.1 hypothetical protein ABB37_01951 [Leptomonas pyrrhocoris]
MVGKMRLSDSSFTRLKACLLLGGAAGCVVYAGVLLRRRLHRSGPSPVVQCPFSDNTVALLRELHDGPFRFGDPTPVAAAARKEAMRRIRRQQARRRHERRKVRLLLFRSQQVHESAQPPPPPSRRLTARPAPKTTRTLAHPNMGNGVADEAVDDDDAPPLPLGSVGGSDLSVCGRSTVEGVDYEGRFAEQHRRLQAKARRQQQQRCTSRLSTDAAADSAKTFVKHARAMLTSPVEGVLVATQSLISSFSGSEAWELRETEQHRRPHSSCSRSTLSSSFSSDAYNTRSTSLSSSSSDSYTTSSTSSFLATASSPASTGGDAASVASAGSAATQERLAWSSVDLGGHHEEPTGPRLSFSNLSHPADSIPSHPRHFLASYSHAASTLASGSLHPPGSTGGGGGGGSSGRAASLTHPTHRHSSSSHPHPSPQPPYICDSTTTSSHQHLHSPSPSGTYVPTESYPEGVLTTAAVTTATTTATNAAPSSAGGDGEEPYNGYSISTALYGPPLFATEMDVTDALAELRGSVCFTADRQGASLNISNCNNAFHSSNSNAGNYSGMSNAGSFGGGGGGGNNNSSTTTGAANLLGGALTLSTMGQPPPPPPPLMMTAMSTASQGFGAVPCASSSQNHHHHARGHRSSGQGGTHHHHHHLHTASTSRPHSGSSTGGGGSGTYQHGSSRTSQRHSHTGSPSYSQLIPIYPPLQRSGSHGGASSSLLPPPSTNTAAPLSRMSSLMHNLTETHPHTGAAAATAAAAGAAAMAVMASSFYSTGEGTAPHRRTAYRLRRWLRRTRRHVRRRMHDGRTALITRAATVWGAAQRACVSVRCGCCQSLQGICQFVSTHGTALATAMAQVVQRGLRQQHLPGCGSAKEMDASVPLSKRAGSDAGIGAAGGSLTSEAAAKAAELAQQASLEANSMEEAISKAVEMLVPCPGRVPTVVLIRAPLGYDVSNDADSLWTALHLDSTSFEEGLVDVVMLEELKTEPLPPVPPVQHTSAHAAASRPFSAPPDTTGASNTSSSQGREPGGEQHTGAPQKRRSMSHPLSHDAAEEQQHQQQQRQSASPSNLFHTSLPPPPPPSSASAAASAAPAERAPPQRSSSSPQATQTGKRAGLRITFELYPAHMFYSSIIRAAILQEKDFALRRAAAELYGGSADLAGSSSGAGEHLNNTSTNAGGGSGGGAYSSPGSPLTFARAASSSAAFAAGQRSSNISHVVGTDANSANSANVLHSVENVCLTPISPGHFLRAPKSPGMHHAYSTPNTTFSHPGNPSTVVSTDGLNGAFGSSTHAHGNGLPLLPLPPPSMPLGSSFATAAAAAAAGSVVGVNGGSSGGGCTIPSPVSLSPTSLSPAFKPAFPGSTPNVVVRLSASYSFPALPPQMVRSPLQSAQGAGPYSARGAPLSIGSSGASVVNVHGGCACTGGCGGNNSTSPQSLSAFGRTYDTGRFSAARRFVNRSEVLLYIHVLRTVVADAPTVATALPSCVLSDLGEEDGVGGARPSAADAAASLGSAAQRSVNTTQCSGGTARHSASACTAKPSSTRRGTHRRGRRGSYDDEGDGMENEPSKRDSGDDENDDGDVNDDDVDGTFDERQEQAQMLLELRQCELEVPVLLRYRLRICHQGSRSLEALKRTEKYAQDHVQVWQDEAKKMLQAMPPTDAAPTEVSTVASGHLLSTVSTPSFMTSSPVPRPADTAGARLPPPVGSYTIHSSGGCGSAAQRPVQPSNSRHGGLSTLSTHPAPLASTQDLEREDDRDGGPLHLPAWAMEVLIRRESMRETLLRDLKEKAFRICSVPLPDMRVHCILPPAVPRYAAAHARGFPLSRTFAEEVLSQQRTLQFILLQREQENQREIAAEIRRARRRQERHDRRRCERHAREEAQLQQQAENRRRQSLKTRLTSSMNPATIVSRVASMVMKSTVKEAHSPNSTGKTEMNGAVSASIPDHLTSEVPSEVVQQQYRHGQPVAGDVYGNASSLTPLAAPSSLEAGGGYATSWTVEDNDAAATTETERAANAREGRAAKRMLLGHPQQRNHPSPSASPQPHQETSLPQYRVVSEKTSTNPTEHEAHFFGGSSRSSTSRETPQEPSLTVAVHTTGTTTTTDTATGTGSSISRVSSGNNPEAFSGRATVTMIGQSSIKTSGEKSLRGPRWNTPSALLTPPSAPLATSTALMSNSSGSSPVPSPLSWPPQPSPSPINSPVHVSSNQNTANGGGGGAVIDGGAVSDRTSPPPSLSGSRNPYWTAVHTATNANTSVTLPQPPLVSTGGGAGAPHPTEGGGGSLSAPLHHATSSSIELSALDGGTETHKPFLFPSLGAANKAGTVVSRHPAWRPGCADGAVGVGGNCRSPPAAPLNVSGSGSFLHPPPPPLPPQVLPSQARTATLGDSYYGYSSAPASAPAIITTSTTTSTTHATRAAHRFTVKAHDIVANMDAATHGGNSELGVPPPVLSFTRPHSALPPTSNSPHTLLSELPASSSARTSLLVPTGIDSGAYIGRFPPSQNSSTNSPLPCEGLPASSTTSTLPAVPNNSMYGTFDAYYGHSIATPQAVLLRQQAQAATVAGLTSSGSGGGAVSPYYSLPVHLRRPPPAAVAAAAGSHATSSMAVASYGPTSGAVEAGTRSGSAVANSIPTTGIAVDSNDGGCRTARASWGNSGSRLRQSSNSPKSTSATHTHNSPPSHSAMMQNLAFQRNGVAGGGSSNHNNTSGNMPRRTGSGLLPYNYSADSVSSMYGTAHYPLYQYPEDAVQTTASVGGGGPSTAAAAAGACTSNFFGANAAHMPSGGGLANMTGITAIYASASSVPGSVYGGHHHHHQHHHGGGGWAGAGGGSPRLIDSPVDVAVAGGVTSGTITPAVMQDTHMNRLKQYNKLLSDLLGVAGGPMRSGISFYYTYGDATALLYNASIQAPSDEDILELLGQQQWAVPAGQEGMGWDGPLGGGGGGVGANSAGLTVGTETPGDNCHHHDNHSAMNGSDTTATVNTAISETALNGSGYASSPPCLSTSTALADGSTIGSSDSSSPPASRVPLTLIGVGDSPPTLLPPRSAGAGGASGGSASCTQTTSANGSAAKKVPESSYNDGKNGGAGASHEDEGCSYLDYGDVPFPEDSMDALEAEQIDAQRTRNENFYSIFEHLHRAYHDAVFEPREPAGSGPPHSPACSAGPPGSTAASAATAAAAARQSLPPLGGFATTASFTGSLGSPHRSPLVYSFKHRVVEYVCSLVRWVGWKVGLTAAVHDGGPRSSISNVDDIDGAAFCGVLSSMPDCSTPSATPSPSGGAQEQSVPERLAKRFPGERVVTFGREWRVASHMDLHNGHYGLSPLQVWMATRYSRRFAGEVFLMDLVAAGSDPYYPAVRVLDEVVAHAVLYYHNHSLRDFTEDLASELGLEYVPQTVWGRRALGLPINETEVQELEGLLYTATRRRQDRRRRQQKVERRQQQQQQEEEEEQRRQARQRRSGSDTKAGAAHPFAKTTASPSNSVRLVQRSEPFADDVAHVNDVDGRTGLPTTFHTDTMDGAGLSESGEAMQHQQTQAFQQQECSPAEASVRPAQATAGGGVAAPVGRKSSSTSAFFPNNSAVEDAPDRCSSSSDGGAGGAGGDGGGVRRRSSPQHSPHDWSGGVDPFAGVDENLWLEMQSYDQEEDEEVFYGATAAAVVGIGSGDINVIPHIYDAVMEREVYDERMLLRELDHLKDFLIENRNVLSSAMLTTTGSNALEAVFGVPATVFPFLLCARESVPLISSIFESLSYHYGSLTYDTFSKMSYDAFHVDRPDVLRHTPRLFRMVNKSRRGCITYEELCRWLARKLSCGNNIQPNAHLLAAIMSLRLPLALVAESREDWDHYRCALKSLSDAEDEEY